VSRKLVASINSTDGWGTDNMNGNAERTKAVDDSMEVDKKKRATKQGAK